MRVLAITLGTSLMLFGCANNSGGNNNGNGGNGGTGGAGGGVGGTGGSGGSGGGGGDAGVGGSVDMAVGPDMAVKLDRDPTAHPAPIDIPTTTTSGTIAAAEVYTIVWVDPANPSSDDMQKGTDLNNFYSWMLGSDYYTTWGAEYGIGKGTAKGVLVIPEAPPATINESAGFGSSDFVTALNKYIGTAGWPKTTDIDANTVFAFFIDPNSVVVQGTSKSCAAFGGYHITGKLTGNKTVPYLVVARCPDQGAGGLTEWQQDTIAASHELGEAAADPGANGKNSGDSSIVLGGGEVGDICIEENATLMNGTTPYLVQRLWSEKTFKDGTDNPCLPADGPWFGAAIVGNDTSAGAAPYNVIVHVDASGNGSADFTIQPFSYDTSITSVQFEMVQSILPAGVTVTPNIARTATAGMWGVGAPGTTFKVHVDAAGYQFPLLSGSTATVPMLAFAVSGTGATRRISNWWGNFTFTTP